MVKNMNEIDRVTKNIDILLKSMSQKETQDTSVSLAIISQGIIEIAKELAILNDFLKGENNGIST